MLLEKVNNPEDLKKLTTEELKLYVEELREFMISVMSKIGGHVAANLGVVELTTALHYVFNAPDDKMIWDVGHQCYAHKIITGRREAFHTIRQDGGISGFTKISESPYDVFGAGHSSTSVSAGLGIAEGEWQKNTTNQVISIIGDGALTAGMAYEGLNHAGHLRRPNYIVIFNDNEMSISENVGALAKFFGRRVNSGLYNRLRAEIKDTLKAISMPEVDIYEKVKRLSHSVKDLFSATGFFEALGFRYVGPIDGHNMDELVETLKSVKQLSEVSMARARENATDLDYESDPPVLIHVRTKKGMGLKTAEARPGDFHGVVGFDLQTGEPTKKPAAAPSYTSIFAQTLTRLAETDNKIVAVTAAMPEGTGLNKFQKHFPERFYDVGIAEQHAVTFSGAMKLSGMRPAVAIYSTFLQRAYDQVIHDVAIQNIALPLFLDRSGIVGADGPTHHGIFDMSFLRCIPGFHIMVPKDENELQHMVYTAMYCEKLSAVRFPRGEGLGVPLDTKLQMLPLGKSEKVLTQLDRVEVSLWAVGPMVQVSLEAAKLLKKNGVLCEVVNARFVKPIDSAALLVDAARADLLVSVEEGAVIGGLGSAILECLSKNRVATPVLSLGIPDEFIEHGAVKRLHSYCGIDAFGVAKSVMERLALSGKVKNRLPPQVEVPAPLHH